MDRRRFLQGLVAAGGLGCLPAVSWAQATSVESLPELKGKLTLYLGRGEGGLYENILDAIRKRNPQLELGVRRGPTAALANAIVAERKAGIDRTDVFWAVDSGAIGLVNQQGATRDLPEDLVSQLRAEFRYTNWLPVSGRIRTLPFHTGSLTADDIPNDVMSLPDTDLRFGWAPAYASFQSFITAMRLLEGEAATTDWIRRMDEKSKRFAGELSVVMAAERGEIDVGFANHYYTLRLRNGKPDARVALGFTENDAGCLVNASGIVALNDRQLAVDFIRYLFTSEVQSFLSREAYEIPLVEGIDPPAGLASLDSISPPRVDLTRLADLQPTLKLMRSAGVL